MGSCSSNNKKASFDYFFWTCSFVILISYLAFFMDPQWLSDSFDAFNEAVFSLINKMWWGLVLSLFFVGSLNYIPREVVMGVLGTKKGLKGIFRATLGGFFLIFATMAFFLWA